MYLVRRFSLTCAFLPSRSNLCCTRSKRHAAVGRMVIACLSSLLRRAGIKCFRICASWLFSSVVCWAAKEREGNSQLSSRRLASCEGNTELIVIIFMEEQLKPRNNLRQRFSIFVMVSQRKTYATNPPNSAQFICTPFLRQNATEDHKNKRPKCRLLNWRTYSQCQVQLGADKCCTVQGATSERTAWD